MIIRYPINLISADVDKSIANISGLIGADKVSVARRGAKLEDVFFVGPYRLIKDLYAKQGDYKKASLRILIDKELRFKQSVREATLLANGVYLPSGYSGELPFLMLYKRVDVLGGKPVLISENYLLPGELAVVPESSELFAVLFFNDGKKCTIPKEVKWYQWHSDNPKVKAEVTRRSRLYRVNYEDILSEDNYIDAQTHVLKRPLLDTKANPGQLLSKKTPVVQVFPIIEDAEAAELLATLKAHQGWVRRTGENNILYTQETFDILEFTQRCDSPTIFKKTVKKLYSKRLLRLISRLSGVEVLALREVYAFRMRANEFITKHADSTLNGQLLVRFNWLLENPKGREYDLRFWQGKRSKPPVVRFKATPNSATIFYVGDTTPHDLTPIPENSDSDRYNIVLTFGTK